MMALKRCPPPEILSAYMDRELPPADYAALSAHLPQCARCSGVLSGLRHVDAALRGAPAPQLGHPRLTVIRGGAHRRLSPTILLIILAVVLSVAAGCAFGAKLLGVFRTEHHVVTQPVGEFPADLQHAIENGREAAATPPPANGVSEIADIEASLGAHLLEPSYLPDGYRLTQRYSPFRMFAELLYLSSANESINIRESNQEYGGTERPPVPPSAAESVNVGVHPAIYVKGGWYQAEPSDVPVWREDIGHSLLFDVDELTVEIVVLPSVSKEDLIRIAESMR
jgi:hypothetical protein